MKVYKDDSKIEIDLQKVEKLMRELGILIQSESILVIHSKSNQGGLITDMEGGSGGGSLPRSFDEEKIVIQK